VKRTLLLLVVASLAGGGMWLHAVEAPAVEREDHRPYRDMAIPECNECHRDADVPPNHVVGWNADHRFVSVRTPANCADCHNQSFCQDCHFGGGIDRDLHVSTAKSAGPDYMPKSHRSDWREIHPIAAFDRPASCNRCHQSPSFCNDCHARFRPEELQFESHRRQFRDIRLSEVGPNHAIFPPESCQTCHPGGLLPTHKWAGGHAREARRNLATCQACHPGGDVCLTCHSAKTGLRVNPHPDNWGDIKGRLDRAAGQRTCVKCH
jgi:hypothetical protein